MLHSQLCGATGSSSRSGEGARAAPPCLRRRSLSLNTPGEWRSIRRLLTATAA
jgi:hypothetical protein